MRTIALFLLTFGIASAADIPVNAKIFIAPMQGSLDGFIAAEMVKQHFPITVVLDEKAADYVLAGQSLTEDDKWYHIAFGVMKDRNEGNVRLFDEHAKTQVWAGAAGDRSLMFGAFRRGGLRKVAERIVVQMRKDLFKELE